VTLGTDATGRLLDERDLALAEELARRAALAVDNALLYQEAHQEIEERKTIEHALRLQAGELARSNAELERFAYLASHDLQEPLRMVMSYTQLLASRYAGRLDADADEFIAFAVEGVKRMGALIQDLLTYSQVGEASRHETTDLGEVLPDVLANLRRSIEESGAVVTSDPLPTVPAPRANMLHLFQNLIGNALKFRSAEAPRIHVGASRQDGEWLLWVKDNGIGIDPRYHRQVFLIFKRLHHRSEYPGTGVGLAICKKTVEQLGGRIWIDSRPGAGTTFFFVLPAGAPAPQATKPPSRMSPSTQL
jgi:light-regulated signal transduction histidine kinase (bacteriophytochrome)